MKCDAAKSRSGETGGGAEATSASTAEADAEEARAEQAALRRSIGLCADCEFRREQRSQRGSVFYRCARADRDDGFPRYPPLPVLRCRGFLSEDAKESRSEDR